MIQFNREARYTGRVVCAALFGGVPVTCCHRLVLMLPPAFNWEFQWGSPRSPPENYIAVGCTSGIYRSISEDLGIQ